MSRLIARPIATRLGKVQHAECLIFRSPGAALTSPKSRHARDTRPSITRSRSDFNR